MLIDAAIAGEGNVITKDAEKILKYKDLIIEFQGMWNVTTKVITSDNRGDWNHFKITQTEPEQHNGKAGN